MGRVPLMRELWERRRELGGRARRRGEQTRLDRLFQRQNIGSPSGQPASAGFADLVPDNSIKIGLFAVIGMLGIDRLGVVSALRCTRDGSVLWQVECASSGRANFDQVFFLLFLFLRRNLVNPDGVR